MSSLKVRLSQPVIRYLRSMGVRVVVYIDDILVLARSQEESLRQTQLLNTANKSPADGLEWVSDPGIWIFLGSGICAAGIISQFDDVRITPAKVICIELNAQAPKVADYANPKTDTFPGVEFEFHDVTMIPEGWLLAIAQDVSLLIISIPCSDMSGLSKAKPRNEYDKIKQKMGLW